MVKLLMLRVAPGLFFLAFWQFLVHSSQRWDFMFGSPLGIGAELIDLLRNGSLGRHVLVTASEALLGFMAGTLIGSLLGLLLWLSPTTFTIVRPYLIALGSVPIFALGPILIFWFGTGLMSKVVLAFLATFVVALVQAHTGATQADIDLVRLTQAFGGGKLTIFCRIIVPSATLWVLAGIRLNIGMALLGAFVGEFISSREGLGYLIILAEGLYNVNQIWAGILGLIGIAIIFHALTMPIERWATRWKG